MTDADPELVSYVEERGFFNLRVVDSKDWRSHDLHLPLPEHKTVLRPLLQQATECWAYELIDGSEALLSAPMLRKNRGRFAVDLSNDPIAGHEFFWNANAGARGSILVLVKADSLNARQIFSGCHSARVMTNPSAGHTPSAFRHARTRAIDDNFVAFCLPRNNGFEWIDVIARPAVARSLFELATVSVRAQ